MSKPLPSSVLWDMDGTIIDSESYWIIAQNKIMSDYNLPLDIIDSSNFVGKHLSGAAKILRERGVTLERHEITQIMLDILYESYSKGQVDWRPGALQLIKAIKHCHLDSKLTVTYRLTE